MNRSVLISLEASTVTVTMDTTKMATFLTSVLIPTNVWRADLTVTSVLILREGEDHNKITLTATVFTTMEETTSHCADKRRIFVYDASL